VGVLPRAPEGFRFLFIAIATFTKWMGAIPVVNITQDVTVKFLQSIIYKFGVPKWVLTDNGTQFKGAKFLRCCIDFNINHQASSAAHPHTNSQVERANRLILQGMKLGCSMTLNQKEGIGIRSCPRYYRYCILMSIELEETPRSTWYTGRMRYYHQKYFLNQPG
jgi:transposase InsO family protein